MSVIAVDCDLRRIHAWCSERGRVCYKAPDIQRILDYTRATDTVIYEIAAPIPFRDGNHRKFLSWMAYNNAIAGALHELCCAKSFLVAGSTVWTLGYPEKDRHLLAGLDTKKDNHDLRECQAMIYFYSTNPGTWLPYPKYLESL